MATYTWGDDTIIGLPDSGSTTTVTGGSSPFTFNPFADVTSVADAGGADTVTLRLIFSDLFLEGATDGATLYTVNGTSTNAVALDSTSTFLGTAAETQAWLTSMFVVADSLNDGFRILLRGYRDDGIFGQPRTYSFQVACYLQGTMIGTPAGERAVESLQPGDLVTTLDGTAKKVKWIGHRSYEAEFGATQAFVRPVVFKAGSLGAGLPVRDLKVSPQHAVLVDGVMIPAAALVNGASIVRDESKTDVTYFHIEMEGHEAIFAEGAPAETFVDHDSRAMFDNADEFGLLYGTAAARPAEQSRLEEGFQLAAIRRRLAEVAGIDTRAAAGPMMGNVERIENGVLHGWVIDAAGAEAVEADVLVDGEVVGRIVANRYRADLDQAGLAGGRGGFTMALPASAQSLSQITLRRVVDGQVLAAPAMETAGA
jgi:hypothetical protein